MTFALIFLSFFAIVLFYLLFRSLFAIMAESELRKCRYVRISTERVEIFARGESLEYYLRAAVFIGARVTVYVAEGDEESAFIAESMQKYYDFEIIYTN